MIKILCQDYKEFLQSLDNNSVNAVITDPPFGISFFSRRRMTTDSLTIRGDDKFFSYETLGEESYRILAENSPIFAYSHWRTYGIHDLELRKSVFAVHEPLIVQKTAAVL